MDETRLPRYLAPTVLLAAIGVALVWLASANYLLFHGVAESVTVAVLLSVFGIAMAGHRTLADRGFFTTLGFTAPFIALILLLHMLAYKGMGVFPAEQQTEITAQLWLASRYLLAGGLLTGMLLMHREVRPALVVVVAATVTGVMLAAIFWWRSFPSAFDAAIGLTPFKIISEYVVIALLVIASVIGFGKRDSVDIRSVRLNAAMFTALVLGEFAFTLYRTDVSGMLAVTGHVLQLVAFSALYAAIIGATVTDPLDRLFKELHREQDRITTKAAFYERLYRLTPVPYQSLDIDGRLITVNRAWEEATGYGADTVVGNSFTEILTADDAPLFDERFKRFRDRGAIDRVEWNIQRADGSTFVAMFNGIVARDADGSFLQTHCILRDVTEERHQEALQLEQARHLEAEVLSRTRELETLNAELQRANAAKGEFLANVSHELRTPLNSIIGFSDILLSGLAGDLQEEQQRQLRMIHDSGGHLLSIVNDILDLTKVDVGRIDLDIEPTDLRDLVREVYDAISPMGTVKGLEVRNICCANGCDMCRARVDSVRVKQILNNLIGNAVKFTDTGSITVELECDATGTAYIRVTDTGPGLDARQLVDVFDEFVQVADRRRAKPEGTGLGLPLSRRLARLHGGEIVAHSTPGFGSSFTLVLPLNMSETR